MREGWTYKKLGEVCKIQYGFAFDSSCFCEDNNYPQLIRIRDVVRGYSETYYKGEIPEGYYVDNGDYLIGMDGEFNIAQWKSEKALLNQRVCKISSSDSTILERYIYYQMQIVLKQIEDETPFVTVKHLSAKKLDSVEFPVPSLSEQQSIVAELDKINELISLKKAQLSDLDSLAQSIFYDMFGDPIENEKGWEVKKLGDECVDMKYGTSRPANENGRYKYLRMGNITSDGHLDLLDLKYIDIPDEEVEKCIVRHGDILFNRTNSYELIGKTCMFDLLEPMIIAGYIIRVRLSNNLHPRYVSIMFNLPSFKKLLRSKAKGAVNQANINSKELASIRIPLPPLPLQQEFAKRIELIEQQKAQISSTIKDLETLLASRMQHWFD